MMASAKGTCQQMVSQADAKSERTVSEAKMRAHSMISEASTRAATMERVARAKAVALDQDAERLHREVMGRLNEKRSSLELKIAGAAHLRAGVPDPAAVLPRVAAARPGQPRIGRAASNTRQGQPLDA